MTTEPHETHGDVENAGSGAVLASRRRSIRPYCTSRMPSAFS